MISSLIHWMDAVGYTGPVWSYRCDGRDEDRTNAVTKHTAVALWWHWSTGLVNRNVFRRWLMCFLLTPVTHVCGGCLRSANQCGSNSAQLVSKCKKRSFQHDHVREQHDFILGFVFVGAYPHTDAKMKGVSPGSSLCTDRWDWEINTSSLRLQHECQWHHHSPD